MNHRSGTRVGASLMLVLVVCAALSTASTDTALAGELVRAEVRGQIVPSDPARVNATPAAFAAGVVAGAAAIGTSAAYDAGKAAGEYLVTLFKNSAPEPSPDAGVEAALAANALLPELLLD